MVDVSMHAMPMNDGGCAHAGGGDGRFDSTAKTRVELFSPSSGARGGHELGAMTEGTLLLRAGLVVILHRIDG